jgi:hypothetical protein
MKHYNPEEHFLDEPVEIQLEGYKAIHRVTGVRYGRNPYGTSRKKVSYAIAQWTRHGLNSWKECRDLPTLMRLANKLEHPFPRNRERWTDQWGGK